MVRVWRRGEGWSVAGEAGGLPGLDAGAQVAVGADVCQGEGGPVEGVRLAAHEVALDGGPLHAHPAARQHHRVLHTPPPPTTLPRILPLPPCVASRLGGAIMSLARVFVRVSESGLLLSPCYASSGFHTFWAYLYACALAQAVTGMWRKAWRQ